MLLSLSPERLLRGQPERRDWPVFERADGKVSTGIWSGTAGASSFMCYRESARSCQMRANASRSVRAMR
jgi:uncharacterized cupin superfamily protein